MTLPIHEHPLLAHLRALQEQGKDVVRTPRGVAVLDPRLAPKINAANFRDATLPDRLLDLVRFRKSPEVQWQELRSGFGAQLQGFGKISQTAALETRLRKQITARLDRELDLALAIQAVFSRALIPMVIANLTTAERGKIEQDQDFKIAAITRQPPRLGPALERARSWQIQNRASRVVRRVLRQRARGQRPRCLDLADPIVELLPRLGPDRASFAVTSVFTAIAGPPGAVAACLLFELCRRPDWAQRIGQEQAEIEPETYYAGALQAAPQSHRFVKETLRRWSAPLVLEREVRRPATVGQEALEEGERLLLSPYLIHHHPREWQEPQVFDPDRWLAGSSRGPLHPYAYVPFGWAPTSCIGGRIGLVELMLLVRLFSLEFRIQTADLSRVEFHLSAVPVPQGFRGTLSRR